MLNLHKCNFKLLLLVQEEEMQNKTFLINIYTGQIE